MVEREVGARVARVVAGLAAFLARAAGAAGGGGGLGALGRRGRLRAAEADVGQSVEVAGEVRFDAHALGRRVGAALHHVVLRARAAARRSRDDGTS